MALEKLGALWKGKPGSKAVLTGKLQDGRKILIFKNDKDGNDKRPDYRLMVDDGTDKPSPKESEEAPF